MNAPESPITFANRIGIKRRTRQGANDSARGLTWEQLVDLAFSAYWRNRPYETPGVPKTTWGSRRGTPGHHA